MVGIIENDPRAGGSTSTEHSLALAVKYACDGPRYTSYPTAPYFDDPGAGERYVRWQHEQNANTISPLSLYVHIPFCRDICYYCACNKIVTRERGTAARYLAYLEREIELQSELIGKRRPVTQLHWGGGTPTYLEDAELTQLMHLLASHFHLVDDTQREYSIEIDPRTVSSESLALLRGLGFNRVSLGIQDFDPLVQKSINRIQRYDQVAELVNTIRKLNYRSMSFDLIYGLPHQDELSVTETVRQVVSLRPDRVACYNYAHLPERFSSQRAIDRLTLPSPQDKLRLHTLIAQGLQDAGYVHIGMDHYVLPSDELAQAQNDGRLQRNFQGYSLRMADDLLGLGVSAISQIGDFYLQNERGLDAYYAGLGQGKLPISRGYQMSGEDFMRRFVIMSLACEMALDFAALQRKFGINFHSHFIGTIRPLQEMQNDGLLIIDESCLEITHAGRPFIRNICMLFDAYLEAPTPTRIQPSYSATV